MKIDNPALEGKPLTGYVKFAMPSIAGLMAISAAPIIDGLFIANFLGVDALAAVNLLIPVFTVLFGVPYMIGIGGSVTGGKYIGEKNKPAANRVYGMTVLTGVFYGLIVIAMGLLFSEQLFSLLGAEQDLYPFLHAYYDTLILFMPIEVSAIVLYYFVRVAGHPTLVSIGVIVGVLANIFLNYLFIVSLQLGLQGAALATGISALIMASILLLYRFSNRAWLKFKPSRSGIKDMAYSAYNGLSDLVDETSAGIVAFALNFIVISRYGSDGVAAFGVVMYSIYIGVLFFFALSETLQAVGSQCFGARDGGRLRQFIKINFVFTVISSLVFSVLLLVFGDVFIGMFIEETETELFELSKSFLAILWPVFIFIGLNLMAAAYLTSIHKPTSSALVSFLRALVLPLGLLWVLVNTFPEIPFLYAVLAAEMITLIVALVLYFRNRPETLFNGTTNGSVPS